MTHQAPGTPGIDTTQALPGRLRAFQRTVAVEKLLSVLPRFQPMLTSLCRAAGCGVAEPQAMLVLVAGDTDHHVLQQGFEPRLPAVHPHRQGVMLSHHVVALGEPLAVEDTGAAWPLDAENGIGAFLGVPVRFQGEVVGCLGVVAPAARAWSTSQQALLTELASLADQAFDTAWRQALADHLHEQAQLRLQALEAGVIQRQMAFRDIRQALALQVTRLRLSADGDRSSDAQWLAHLHEQLGEVNEGVLSGLGAPVMPSQTAHTTCAELLALAVHVVAPERVRLDATHPDDEGPLSQQVDAVQQPGLLRMFVTLLREALRHLPAEQSLSLRLLPQQASGHGALRVRACSAAGAEPGFGSDLPQHIEALLCDTMKPFASRLWLDDAEGLSLVLSWEGLGASASG